MYQQFHYWVKIHKNPLSKMPGWLTFNLFDVHSINVVWDATEDRPLAVQIATADAQFNLDGCGMAQFFVAWEEFQKVSHDDFDSLVNAEPFSRTFRFTGEAPEVGLIRPAAPSDIPS